LFVDDIEEYVEAARDFGFETFHFTDFKKSTKELERYLKNAGVTRS